VFFFQAEDGIRDGHVTGVQTCALPISGGGARAPMTTRKGRRWSLDVTTKSNALDLEANIFKRDDPQSIARSLKRSAERSHRRKRSEERRVGKECRTRWTTSR